jgi:hypothetical protein
MATTIFGASPSGRGPKRNPRAVGSARGTRLEGLESEKGQGRDSALRGADSILKFWKSTLPWVMSS